MEIRTAAESDLSEILELGKGFGHLMLYQKDPEIMEKYLPRILVAEEITYPEDIVPYPESELVGTQKGIVGYYHYIVSGDSGFEEMLRCYRQFPEKLVRETLVFYSSVPESKERLCVCMQGASHREVFKEFIKYLQERYPEIWCYCSIKSRRPETYKELGFTFNPTEQYTFFNIHKGDLSTYQLGRWRK